MPDRIMYGERALMEKPPKLWVSWPLILSALILAGLCGLPATRWLVRQQIKLQFGLNAAVVSLLRDLGVQSELAEKKAPEPKTVVRPVAERHPADFQIQLAYVLYSSDGEEAQITGLRRLETLFPNSPS